MIVFSTAEAFNRAVNVLALEAVEYEVDASELTIQVDDEYAAVIVLESHEITDFVVNTGDEGPDDSMDGDFDSGMASAGLGTAEDYGYFGCGED